jgi:hypothetical protein
MKTFLVDLDGLATDIFKDVMGFTLTTGLNFRKIDQRMESGTGRTLIIETETKIEERVLKDFLLKHNVTPIIIGSANKASLDGKKLGIFKQVTGDNLSNFYLDTSTGKKFSIVE